MSRHLEAHGDEGGEPQSVGQEVDLRDAVGKKAPESHDVGCLQLHHHVREMPKQGQKALHQGGRCLPR